MHEVIGHAKRKAFFVCFNEKMITAAQTYNTKQNKLEHNLIVIIKWTEKCIHDHNENNSLYNLK